MSAWYEKSRRRNLLDFHIPDWNPSFLASFDPERFADSVAAAHSTAATVFANTHTGLCNYPTRVGAMHRGHRGKDALGGMIDALHRRGIDVVIYYCTIYCDWYWDTHPDARIVDADGRSEKLLMNSQGKPRRFSVSCPNNAGYREFVVAQLRELCDGYEFEGVWPDMTFWPNVCYCTACRARYRAETGKEIPTVINWESPEWVGFQRKRQEWLRDFAHLVTSTIKERKPHVTVAHQSWTFFGDWMFGASVDLANESDWLSADLYGDRYSLSFYAKLFYGLSTVKPFEHIDTWCYPNIHEHVVPRSEEHLRLNAFSALSNDGAMVFIDAIDPLGEVHSRIYETIGRVYDSIKPLEQHLGGTFVQDVGIYYSFDSNFDLAENGKEVGWARYNFEPGRPAPSPSAHRNAALSLGKTLVQHHIPFGVVTKRDLARLSDYRIIALPNVVMLDADELAALTDYVRRGGSLYASKATSLLGSDGTRHANFGLAELFGVDLECETEEIVTYLSPEPSYAADFTPYDPAGPYTLYDSQMKVRLRPGAELAATITLPYTDPRGTKYASILTDPPGLPTRLPALVVNRFGKGTVIYSAGAIEIADHDSQRAVVARLMGRLAPEGFSISSNVHKSVEITTFRQLDRRRHILNLVNFQAELPNIPVRDIVIDAAVGDSSVTGVRRLPDGDEIAFVQNGGRARFTLPLLQDYAMIELRVAGRGAE